MKILLVAATPFEILPLLQSLPQSHQTIEEYLYRNDKQEIRVLVTGVGPTHTALAMGLALSTYRPDLAINLGIAGSFDPELQLGQVVNVAAELWGDLGVEEADGGLTDVFELGLCPANQYPYINGRLYNTEIEGFDFMTSVRGLTVSKVHGKAESIEKIVKKYNPDIETMEGAAFFLACLQLKIPFLAIRAISNYVEPRNKDNWEIALAIDNLNRVAGDLLSTLAGE